MKSSILILTVLIGVLLIALAAVPGRKIPQPDAITPSAEEQRRIEQTLQQLPLYFIENQGQLDKQVAYYLQGQDTAVYFTSTGVTFAQTTPSAAPLADDKRPSAGNPTASLTGAAGDEIQRWSVKLDFVGSNPNVRPIGQAQTEAVISYFKGPAADWHTGLPTYGRLVYPDLWPGIDLIYEGTASQLKYTFIVQPGADPAQIRLAYRGATDVTLNAAGQMMVSTPIGGFLDDTPVAYQEIDGERIAVEMAYVLDSDTASKRLRPFHTSKQVTAMETHSFGFRLGDYDPNQPLILDPVVLLYAGYIGGASDDVGNGIAVDGSGNAYVTGYTSSSEDTFPVLVGPDLTYNGNSDPFNYDAFVAKVSSSGDSLLYAGYIGGSDLDIGEGIAVDGLGNAYVTGVTYSTEATFPVLVGPDLTFNEGVNDAFVAKVSSSGDSLLYAGYIGGSNNDNGNDIAVDGSGNAYITGGTHSTEATFPVLVGPDLTHNGGADAFVAKVSSSGESLLYAGYIGGVEGEFGVGIAMDGSGNTYVTGLTSSTEVTFPVLVGPDLTYNGDEGYSDAFVAKVSSSGISLLYAGYIGGSSGEGGRAVAVDELGNAYVTGMTFSTEATFPVLVGPDLTHNGNDDAFVAKVSSSGDALLYAGYIGGVDGESGGGIAVDGSGSAYVTGQTTSTEATFPVLVGPDLTHNGSWDAFVAKVNSSGESLLYAGYIGGSANDIGNGIAVDGLGNAYIIGRTHSTEATFPVLVGPDLTYNGDLKDFDDAFVAKVVIDDIVPVSSASSPVYANMAPITITWNASDDLSGVSTTALWVKFGSGGTWTDSTLSQPGNTGNFAYTPPNGDGVYYFATVATDNAGNVEALPSDSGDASTIYDTATPTSMASSPDFATTAPITITWTASDATSGIITTTLWVKVGDSGTWADLGLSQSGTSGTFYYNPTSGNNTYYFATVSTDYAGNVEVTPSGAGDDSTVYEVTFTVFLPIILNHSVSGNQAIR